MLGELESVLFSFFFEELGRFSATVKIIELDKPRERRYHRKLERGVMAFHEEKRYIVLTMFETIE